MFIRRTQTRNRTSGEPYVTFRLVHSERVGSAVKQTTLLSRPCNTAAARIKPRFYAHFTSTESLEKRYW